MERLAKILNMAPNILANLLNPTTDSVNPTTDSVIPPLIQ